MNYGTSSALKTSTSRSGQRHSEQEQAIVSCSVCSKDMGIPLWHDDCHYLTGRTTRPTTPSLHQTGKTVTMRTIISPPRRFMSDAR